MVRLYDVAARLNGLRAISQEGLACCDDSELNTNFPLMGLV